MSEQPKNLSGKWLVVALTVLLLLGVYVVGYFALSEKSEGLAVVRDFASVSLCRIYRPLGWCECRLTGKSIYHTRLRDKTANFAEGDNPIVNAFHPE